MKIQSFSHLLKKQQRGNNNIEPIKIISVTDKLESEMFIEILENNNIPAYSSDNGAGEYFNVSMGYSVFGTDIYVREEDAKKALDILSGLRSEDEDIEKKEDFPIFKKRTFLARIMLGFIFLSTIFFIIVGYIL